MSGQYRGASSIAPFLLEARGCSAWMEGCCLFQPPAAKPVHDTAGPGILAAARGMAEEKSMLKAGFAFLMLIAAASVVAQQDLPPPFPRTNATKLFENERINVWDIVWPKGQPTVLHRHIYDQVGTYYQRGGRVITTSEGEKRSGTTEVG